MSYFDGFARMIPLWFGLLVVRTFLPKNSARFLGEYLVLAFTVSSLFFLCSDTVSASVFDSSWNEFLFYNALFDIIVRVLMYVGMLLSKKNFSACL